MDKQESESVSKMSVSASMTVQSQKPASRHSSRHSKKSHHSSRASSHSSRASTISSLHVKVAAQAAEAQAQLKYMKEENQLQLEELRVQQEAEEQKRQATEQAARVKQETQERQIKLEQEAQERQIKLEQEAQEKKMQLEKEAEEQQRIKQEQQRKLEHVTKLQQMQIKQRKHEMEIKRDLDIATAKLHALQIGSDTISLHEEVLLALPTSPDRVRQYVEQHAISDDEPQHGSPSTPHLPQHSQTTTEDVLPTGNVERKTEIMQLARQNDEPEQQTSNARTPQSGTRQDKKVVNFSSQDVRNIVSFDTTHNTVPKKPDGLNVHATSFTHSSSANQNRVRSQQNMYNTTAYAPLHGENVKEMTVIKDCGYNPNNVGYQPETAYDVQKQQPLPNDKPPTPPIAINITDLAKVIAEQCNTQRLPPPEPGIFSGNPLEYNLWKSSFDLLIEPKNLQSSDKLYYLQKSLAGPAKECVKGFLLERTDASYTDARARLEMRFGDPFKIAAAFKKKLHDWPKLVKNDMQALQKFSDFLKQCETAKRVNNSLRILDDAEMNTVMLHKLPEAMVKAWSRIVFDYKNLTASYPPFEQFVRFIDKEAMIASDPVISEVMTKAKDTHKPAKKVFSKNNAESFASEATTNKEKSPKAQGKEEPRMENKPVTSKWPCFHCKNDHHINDCPKFLQLSLEERKKYAETNKLCYSCLNQKHVAKDCRYKKRCKTCHNRHPTSLHDENWKKGDQKKEKEGAVSLFSSNSTSDKRCTMILPVFVSRQGNEEKEVLVYALLDTQSNATFITTNVCQKLEEEGTVTYLNLTTLSAEKEPVSCNKMTGLQVRGFNSTKQIPIHAAFTQQNIPANRDCIPTPDIASTFPHLSKVAGELMPKSDCEFGLLIGNDCPKAFKPREFVSSPNEDAFAWRTDLGWGVMGIADCSTLDDHDIVTHKIITQEVLAPIADRETVSFSVKAAKPKEIINPIDLNNLIDAEFATSLDAHKPKRSIDDQKFLNTLNDGIKRTADAHFEMPLPFRDVDPVLPNNRSLAEKRLQGLQKKMHKDEAYRDEYTKFMTNIIDKGFAEKCESTPASNVWYMPHHGVYHPKKKKLRVVFDASAKYAGASLNDTLLQGPDLINGLLGVLCRFRKEPIAIMCDIEQMFYQFKVIKEHRDYLRFLWWDVFNQPPVEYRMTVHLFGATSSPGCANFGLRMAADYGEEEFGKVAADFIRNDFYVDDGLTSVASVEEGRSLVYNTQKICAKSGIHLHKFASNNQEVLEAIPKSERAQELQNVDLLRSCEVVERTLGVEWSISNDSFQFKVVFQARPPTRRGILSSVSSVYDPVGFLAPVVLTGKIILQEICKQGLDWDTPLPTDIIERWDTWKRDLKELESFKVPRCYKPTDFGDVATIELHHFSDASTVGFGQCSYLRLIDSNNNIACSLVMAKAKVAPVKQVTVPRLELSAAVLSAKIGNFLSRELKYESIQEYFWTDSTVVLGYINTDAKRFHVFVANRIQQIRDITEPKQWHYVNTESNPADCVSRGMTAQKFIQNDSWLNGPSFLKCHPLSEFKRNSEVITEDPEIKRVYTLASIANNADDIQQSWTRFSSWQRLQRAVAQCLRFKRILRQRIANTKGDKRNGIAIKMNVESICESEREIIKSVQRASFITEIERLQSGNQVKESSNIHNLDPFLDDDGVLRVGGRLQNSPLSPELKHPIILPKDNHVSALIVRHIHEKTHQGRGSTMNHIRQSGYWIIGCKAMVSRIIHCCLTCRKFRARLQYQKMSALPSDRTENVPPFTYCAVDYFGPFIIRIKRSDVPRYGVLFTCLTSRAVHLEVAESLDTDAFINALRRFVAIRGPVRHIRSDRGTNFVGAKNVLEKEMAAMKMDKVKDYLLSENCDIVEFKMNPPSASHMGGVWERQIRTVRSVLQPMLDKIGTQLDDDLLRTIFYEVMAIVNSRPLSVDCLHDPFSEVLSPNQLLTMKSQVVLPPPGHFVPQDIYATRRWRRAQYVLNVFWSKWQAEYLSEMQKRQKWTDVQRNMSVGDIVMLKEENSPRNTWPIAVVEEVYPSQDGKVRKIKVRVADQNMNKRGVRTKAQVLLERPVHKCVLLQESSRKV